MNALVVALQLVACSPEGQAWLLVDGRLQPELDALAFGAQPYGTAVSRTVAVQNVGSKPVRAVLRIEGSAAERFDASWPGGQLPAQATEVLQVWFDPAADRDAADALLVLEVTGDPGAGVELPLSGETEPDGDGDGFEHEALGGVDCDDSDPLVNPDAAEVWYDGVDQDCDDASDFDADGDSHDAEPEGPDCDDEDPTVNPLAEDTWYDGVDQDCDDASDYDADGDGYDIVPEGDDCDDDNPRVHPGTVENWYDGTDQDCDGASDYDADGDGLDAEPWGPDCDDAAASTGPGEPELDDLADQDCDGWIDEDFVAAGDVVITELMCRPAEVPEPDGQYVELVNASSREVVLVGWTLAFEGVEHTIESTLALAAGDRMLLCSNASTSANGGLGCDESWGGLFQLQDSDGDLAISLGSDAIDTVQWTPSWSVPTGASLSLDPSLETAGANDGAGAWCAASSSYGSGDLGTPGAVNDVCP